MSKMKLWSLSIIISAVLAAVLVNLWLQMDDYVISNNAQLINAEAAERYLQTHHDGDVDLPNTVRIKTGIFIQSLKFFNSSEVNITGYIWQHFPLDRYRGQTNDVIEPDFILPEQVNTASDSVMQLAYRRVSSDEQSEVIGWYFESTLKQEFDYTKYPFDHKTVWVRLWPKEFSENVILVPDFDAYDATGADDIFGIEQKIVLGAWIRENTFFDYKTSNYDTNFGIPNYVGQKHFPELHYNFVVKRRFDNAFIVYVLPLFLVTILLFAALLTITDSPKSNDLLGFNTSGFLGMCSALFFVVMIAHIQLREQFAGSSVVYLEYFYILMYLLLVGGTINTYLFAIRPKALAKYILYKDNILPKIGFWPFVFLSLDIITLQFI